jgi:hypothetical protein
VFVTVQLLQQLRHLTADPDRAEGLAAALSGLCVDVQVAVPSWTSVSIVLTSANHAGLEVVILAPGEQDGTEVLSSFAVPLSELDPRDQLIVRARAAGAFLVLADDLASGLGDAHPIILDRHLDPPPSAETAAAMFAGLGVVDQAIGVLLDRGLSPTQAHQDLWRRARASGVSVAAAARSLLESVSGPREPDAHGH